MKHFDQMVMFHFFVFQYEQVHDLMDELKLDYRFEKQALRALQEAAEEYMTELFTSA